MTAAWTICKLSDSLRPGSFSSHFLATAAVVVVSRGIWRADFAPAAAGLTCVPLVWTDSEAV